MCRPALCLDIGRSNSVSPPSARPKNKVCSPHGVSAAQKKHTTQKNKVCSARRVSIDNVFGKSSCPHVQSSQQLNLFSRTAPRHHARHLPRRARRGHCEPSTMPSSPFLMGVGGVLLIALGLGNVRRCLGCWCRKISY